MKIEKRFIALIILILSLFSNSSYGQINKSIELKISDFSQSTITKNGMNYDCVKLKNAAIPTIFGNPDLPILHYRFYIPMNQKAVSVTFKTKKQDVIQLINDLMPAQKPLLTTWDKQDTTFILPNKQIYGSASIYPEIQARIADIDYLDGDLQLVSIEVYPMRYITNSKKIVYSSQFELQIETVTNDNADGKRIHPKKRMTEVMSVLKSLVVNSEVVTSDSNSIIIKPSSSSSKVMAKVGASTTTTLPYYEYVIITDASLVSGFTDFVNWKRRKGINIGIVTTNDIYSNYTGDTISKPVINDNAGKVRQYLKDAHTNVNKTTWALIAGDYPTNVPVKMTNSTYHGCIVTTDSYFSDLHGNWAGNDPLCIPDIYVGRLICSNTTDIQSWVKKVLLYEQNPGNGDYSYLLNAYHIEADEMQYYGEATSVKSCLSNYNSQWTHWYMSEYPTANATYDSNGQILTPTNYAGQYGTSKGSDAIAGWNNARHYGLVDWFCHGGTTNASYSAGNSSGIGTMTTGLNAGTPLPVWRLESQDAFTGLPDQTNNGLDNLTNWNYSSVLYSISCIVTPFDRTSHYNNRGVMNCGEAFTILPQTGGIAFLGNTYDGLIGFSTEMYKKFVENIYMDDFHSHLGVAECYSRYTYGNTEIYLCHNLVGCPETQMWTAVPTKFSSATVTKNGTTVTVNTGGISNCKICVMSASDNGASYFSVDSLTAGKTFYNVPNSYYVTITKHNYIPYMYSSDYYMQNATYTGTQTINANNVIGGSNVTTSKPTGPITIQSGAKITIDADGSTTINDSFEVQDGAQLEIK